MPTFFQRFRRFVGLGRDGDDDDIVHFNPEEAELKRYALYFAKSKQLEYRIHAQWRLLMLLAYELGGKTPREKMDFLLLKIQGVAAIMQSSVMPFLNIRNNDKVSTAVLAYTRAIGRTLRDCRLTRRDMARYDEDEQEMMLLQAENLAEIRFFGPSRFLSTFSFGDEVQDTKDVVIAFRGGGYLPQLPDQVTANPTAGSNTSNMLGDLRKYPELMDGRIVAKEEREKRRSWRRSTK